MTSKKAKLKTTPKTAAKKETALATIHNESPIVVISSSVAGRHARDIPLDLLSNYAGSMTDPELVTLTSELALIDARISSLMRRLKAETQKPGDEGEIGGAGDWQQAHLAYKLLRRGLLVRDKTQQQEALLRLDSLFTRVADSKDVWNEAMELIERRRKLVESEARAQMRMCQYFKAKDVDAFVNSLMNAVRAEVTNTESLNRIAASLRVGAAKLQPVV